MSMNVGTVKEPIQLISYKICPYAQRVRFALEELNLAYSVRFINPYAAKPDWFVRLSPQAKVPVLRIGDTAICESGIILDYLDEISDSGILPRAAQARASCRRLIERVHRFHSILGIIITTNDRSKFGASMVEFNRQLGHLEAELQSRESVFMDCKILKFYYGPMLYLAASIAQIVGRDFIASSRMLNQWFYSITEKSSFQQTIEQDYLPLLIDFFVSRDSIVSVYAKGYSMPEGDAFSVSNIEIG